MEAVKGFRDTVCVVWTGAGRTCGVMMEILHSLKTSPLTFSSTGPWISLNILPTWKWMSAYYICGNITGPPLHRCVCCAVPCCACKYNCCLFVFSSTSKSVHAVKQQYWCVCVKWSRDNLYKHVLLSGLLSAHWPSATATYTHSHKDPGMTRSIKTSIMVNWVASWRWPIFITTDISEIMSSS